MNEFKKTLIACFSIYGIITIGFLIFGDNEKIAMIGLCGMILSVLYLVIGVFACIPKNGRETGKAMLLSAGIVLLIGFSVCGLFPHKLNMH